MSIPGPQAIAALDEALRDIRREEDDILRKLVRALERRVKLRESETELLRPLLEKRLPDEPGIVLGGALGRASLGLRTQLQQRAATLSGNMQTLRQLETGIAERVAQRTAALQAIEQQQQVLRGLAPRIAGAVSRVPDYEAQRQALLGLKAIAAAARARSRKAEAERELKAQPFEADPLFAYLLQRGYGTPAYRGRGLAALLDARIGRLVGFPAAQLDYLVLNALPGLLRTEAERQAARAGAAEDRLDLLEQAAIDTAGGGPARTALAEAQARIAGLDEQIAALDRQREAVIAEAAERAGLDEAPVEDTVRAALRALGHPDLPALLAALRQAPGGDAAETAAQLDDLRLRLGEEAADNRDLNARLSTLAQRRRDLEAVEAELKRRHFDDPRSVFRDAALIGPALDDFLTGGADAAAFLRLWRQAQSWVPGTLDWGGGVGLPHHGREAADPA